jgi:lysophospholipase L1-like esterase
MNPRRSEKLRIVCLGDSTTAGTPAFLSPVEAPPNGSGNEMSQYAYWMAKSHPDWEVMNKGVNGERTDQVLARFQRDVADASPKFVVILAGVNDIYQGFPVEFPIRNLLRTYNRALAIGSTPVLCSVLPYDSMSQGQANARRQVNNWIEAEAKERSVPFVDTGIVVAKKGEPDKLQGTPDGLHPDFEGYRKMGEAIAAAIESRLAESNLHERL